jgi:hypothetical protein
MAVSATPRETSSPDKLLPTDVQELENCRECKRPEREGSKLRRSSHLIDAKGDDSLLQSTAQKVQRVQFFGDGATKKSEPSNFLLATPTKLDASDL